jgi:hypothetical protein
MTEPIRPLSSKTQTPEAQRGYSKADSILFQAWLILFLMVICFALISYLLPFILTTFAK